ncbi:TspO/MBR family protein [Nesterenkonia haasae]|uniref:TspO/MBR family protein n=1 Tax=Nesterenkonia haasae TaxID=2587813 RepID=UPI002E2BB350|nr:TspO/MBR family protein [Nesterenkonia haasae]
MTQGTTQTTNRDSTFKQIVALILFVGIPQAVGFLGSQLTQDETDGWYEQADRAPWTPPDAVFGPVWTVLYLSMGVAAWLVWRRRHSVNAKLALTLFVVQLVLNGIWSPLFFGGYPVMGTAALWAAMVLIVVLIVAIAATIWRFWPISRLAGVLLLPYLAWTVYASTLNLYIALMN